MKKHSASLIIFTFLLALISSITYAEYTTPEPDIDKVTVKLHIDITRAMFNGTNILKKLELTQESLHTLNRLKVYKFIANYSHFQKEIDQLVSIITSVNTEMAQVMDTENPTTEQLRNLFEYTYIIWYLIDAQILNSSEHLYDIKTIHAKRYDIQSKIAGLTNADSINGNINLGELGLQSRIWLAIYHLQSTLWEKEEQDVYLQPLIEFLSFLNEQKIESPKIEEETLHTRIVEIQIYYVTEQYQLCIDSVDKYFGETIKTLTPETPESETTKAAVCALSHKIKCLGSQIRPDIFSIRNSIRLIQKNLKDKSNFKAYLDDVRKEAGQYTLNPDKEKRLQKAMKRAEYLTTFGDRHTDESPRQDPLVQKWRLVFKFYKALGMEKLSDYKKTELIQKYPKRFEEDRVMAKIQKQRQQMQERQQKQKTAREKDEKYERWNHISQYAIGSLITILTLIIATRKRRAEEEKDEKDDSRWKGV